MLKIYNPELKEKLIAEMKHYEDYSDYVCGVGWADWMEEYTSAPDGEPASEEEVDIINEFMRECWDEAHEQ